MFIGKYFSYLKDLVKIIYKFKLPQFVQMPINDIFTC